MSDLKTRTKAYAIQICRLMKQTRLDPIDRDLARQLVRSATSVGANHRAAMRARSRADMIAKLKIVEEECDETLYWLELIQDLEIVDGDRVSPLLDEGSQILRMVVASIGTLRSRDSKSKATR